MKEGNGSYKMFIKKPRERNNSINSTGNIIPSKNIRRYLKYVFNLRAVIASIGEGKIIPANPAGCKCKQKRSVN